MRVGNLDQASRHHVAGWAAEQRRPDAALTIVIEIDGIEVARAAANEPRPGLVAGDRFATADHGFTYRFDAMLDPALPHRVAVRFAAGLELLPNGEQVIPADVPAAAPAAAALSPVLVTGPGRSGSTWLMSVLARAPGIVVTDIVPYEMRLIAYYAHACSVLTAPGDLARATHPDRIAADRLHIGCNPYNIAPYPGAFQVPEALRSYTDVFLTSAFGGTFRGAITEFYARLAADQGKRGARLFAEKTNHLHRPTRAFARRIFEGAREIVLVRDPRDVLASHIAFFHADPGQAFATLTEACRELLATRNENRTDVLILRYEDLMRRRADSLRTLAGFLDTDLGGPAAGAEDTLFRTHATSDSPEASIGRWRTALPEAAQAKCHEAWHEFLEAFGY